MNIKHLFRYVLPAVVLLACTAAPARAQDDGGSLTADRRPIYQQTDPDAPFYMANRRALVGTSCVVNRVVSAVSVGSWVDGLNNLTDEDLENYATFPEIVGASVGADPFISVRDVEHVYKGGTQAGFCMVASSGGGLLSLDVIKALRIFTYLDGKKQEELTPTGDGGSGVNLSLITIPGSDEACVYLTVTTTEGKDFDEIGLVVGGGVNLSVGGSTRIKYAFVGRAKETILTTERVAQYDPQGEAYGPGDVRIEKSQGWNPVLLGLPFSIDSESIKALTDEDTENTVALVPILAVGYQGGVKLTLGHTNGDNEEVFDAGTEIGFAYNFGNVLGLDVGSWIDIVLFDADGDEVQRSTLSAEAVGLGVGEGGEGVASITSSVPFSAAELRFHTVLSVRVGAIGIHYGFVREKPDVDHHCPINPTLNTNVCDEQNTFQLEANPELSVTWSLKSAPEGATVQVTPGGYVTNLNEVPGVYVFTATAADGCSEDVVINVGDELGTEAGATACGTPLVNGNGLASGTYELSEDIFEGSGSLLSMRDIEGKDNILNNNYEDYCEYKASLSLAGNLGIVGVKRTDGLIFDGAAAGAETQRVGFVVEFSSTGLNLSALNYFLIRLYRGGEQVYEHVIDESNTVSVGLAGSERVQKVRFSIEVPTEIDGQPVQFDEMALWQAGVLNLTLSNTKIYYPFIEREADHCGDPLGCSSEIVSTSTTGSTINGNATQVAAGVQVAGVVNNLGSLVDASFDTPLAIANTVGVGSGKVIAINMGRTLDFRHQLGIVVDNKTYLAGVDVGGWLTVRTYYRGNPTGDKFTDWSVLGVNAIGYGDKSYLVMQPKYRYDEVRIEIAAVAGVLDVQNFYGLFLRGDIDNDGIPDCQDPESCSETISDLDVASVCVGDVITVSGKGVSGADYTISMPEQDVEEHIKTETDGTFSRTYPTKQAGRFTMMFYNGSGEVISSTTYTVHPTVTTWKKQPVSTDWNEWNNWTDGSPYLCTDVIIPSDATAYPVLVPPTATDGEGTLLPQEADLYGCRDIHFEPRAAVDAPQRLNYRRAWVEAELLPNRYYWLAAPLKHMYTGDFFIPAAMQGTHTAPYFTELTPETAPENRFDPQVFQRIWATAAPGRLYDGAETTVAGVSEGQWSRHFNHVAYDYAAEDRAGAFSLWVDNGSLPATQGFRFRFPKTHTAYSYYSDYDGQQLAVINTLTRGEGDEIYRFGYEATADANLMMDYTRTDGKNTTEHRTVYTGVLPLTLHVKAESATTDFLVGNPTMGRIYLAPFFEENVDVAAVRLLRDGSTAVTVSRDGLATDPAATYVNPMESFVVVLDAGGMQADVTLTDETLLPAETAATTTAGTLRVSVEGRGATASMLLAPGAGGVPTLLDSEERTPLALFGLADGTAYDILSAGDVTELGLLASEADTLRFRFEAGEGTDLAGYRLLDRATGAVYELDDVPALPAGGVTLGRFALATTAALDDAPTAVADVYVTLTGRTATVCSTAEPIGALMLTAADGRTLTRRTGITANETSVQLRGGVQVLTVTLQDGTQRTFKLLAR